MYTVYSNVKLCVHRRNGSDILWQNCGKRWNYNDEDPPLSMYNSLRSIVRNIFALSILFLATPFSDTPMYCALLFITVLSYNYMYAESRYVNRRRLVLSHLMLMTRTL